MVGGGGGVGGERERREGVLCAAPVGKAGLIRAIFAF
jgi:hypothetical protein